MRVVSDCRESFSVRPLACYLELCSGTTATEEVNRINEALEPLYLMQAAREPNSHDGGSNRWRSSCSEWFIDGEADGRQGCYSRRCILFGERYMNRSAMFQQSGERLR